MLTSAWLTWGIVAAAILGVITRPLAWPEFIWALGGAGLLVGLGLLPGSDAWSAVLKGSDVYLFLTGMMLLSELARTAGLFDWLAAQAVRLARGSAARLFTLVFGVGTLVTVFLSNDATAIVLTPAVAAATRAANVEKPLPYLLICAFIANAASFVLPISNPANLVIYSSQMPPLFEWLPHYAVASLLSVTATYAMLRWTQRKILPRHLSADITVPPLSSAGGTAAIGIIATAIVLLVASGMGWQLGLPTALAGLATALLMFARSQAGVAEVGRNIAWGVLPLVAGLFVLVQALQSTGVTRMLASWLQALVQHALISASWAAGIAVALGCNMVNNLSAGLLAGRVADAAHVTGHVRAAILIGVDLGPNLSVTGSLATILWLTALRREGQGVSAWAFFKVGALVMPPALLLALAGAFAAG